MSYSNNIWDVVTYLAPLYSSYQAPSCEFNFNSIAPVLAKLAYLSMLLFILKMACTVGSAGHLKDKYLTFSDKTTLPKTLLSK